MTVDTSDPVPAQPLYIVREATLSEYLEWCRNNSDIGLDFGPSDVTGRYFYEVSTD